MKNILAEKPAEKLHGRLLASVNFVANEDIFNKDILDIGCGYGWCELEFLKHGAKMITATEITENDLRTIRQNISDPRLVTLSADACSLPFDNNVFDTVVVWEVLEHLPKHTEPRMFEEIHRVLKPGGYLYLSTPHRSFFTNILDPAWWLIGHRHYAAKDLQKLAQKNNFQIVKTYITGNWWTLFAIVDLYISKWILRRKQLFREFESKKEDQEFNRRGFVNMFIKLKKI